MSTESTEHIERIASDWLARRDAGEWPAEAQRELDAWLGESMSHRVAYWRLERAWDSTRRLKALGAGIQSDRPPPPGQLNLSPFFNRPPLDGGAEAIPETPVVTRWYFGKGRAVAASVILAAATACVAFWWPASKHYETPIGATTSLPISDGSKVILNTASEIRVAITEKERRIELEHGEAFFDVAKDPKRPFVVVAGDKRVVAVGTQFSVRRDLDKASDSIQVVVTEGAVRVESVGGKGVENLSAKPLTAGTVALANRSGLMVQRKALSEAEEQLAWRNGMLVFRDATLADAAAQFNRYSERQIVIEDAETANLRIEGMFLATYVDAFVRLLEQGYPVDAELDKQKIIVRARKD